MRNQIISVRLEKLTKILGFEKSAKLVENNLEIERFAEDKFGRRMLDAQVLSIVAANSVPGTMLDMGTYLGHSAARMAVNAPESIVYTVNIHPDELASSGKLSTGCPRIEDIGRFYRELKLTNVRQIISNTMHFKPPCGLEEISLAYLDACHDIEYVINDTMRILPYVRPGGFVLWHDFSPIWESKYPWIKEVMTAVRSLNKEGIISQPIFHVPFSWIGIWRKPCSVRKLT